MASPSKGAEISVCKVQRSTGSLLRFKFHIPVRDILNEYLTSPGRRVCSANFEGVSVGDKDIVFDVKLATRNNCLVIHLALNTQRLENVLLLKCRAVPKGLGVHAEHWKPIEFYGGTSQTGESNEINARITQKWTINNSLFQDLTVPDSSSGQIEQPTVYISGLYFYSEPSVTMQKELKVLFNNTGLSDVEIFVGEKTFPGHKCILSSRSTFFQAMFNSNMKESVENVVKLQEEEPDVFEQVLSYIYTDECTNISLMASDLLVRADKYGIKGLRLACEEQMMKTMNKENVCDYLLRSQMANSKRIYDECVQFIARYSKEVMKTEGWRKFKDMENSGRLMSDIMERMNE